MLLKFTSFSTRRTLLRLAILLTILLLVQHYLPRYGPPYMDSITASQNNHNITRPQSSTRIAKATILYDHSASIYTRVQALHDKHNAKYNYKSLILRTPLVKGFANKLYWLQHIITTELQVLVEERTEWILYHDPHILPHSLHPLHHLLPPPTLTPQPHILATKPDNHTFTSRIFFIRVSSTSLRILTLAIAAVHTQSGVDWGADVPGAAVQWVLEQERWRGIVVYLPFEVLCGMNGSEMRHVRGLRELEQVVRYAEVAGMDHDGEAQGRQVREFWQVMGEARRVLEEAEEQGKKVREEVRVLKEWVELFAFDVQGLRERIVRVKAAMGNVVGS